MDEHPAARLIRLSGRPLSEHKCTGEYVKIRDECYLCLECHAYVQAPNEGQHAVGSQN